MPRCHPLPGTPKAHTVLSGMRKASLAALTRQGHVRLAAASTGQHLLEMTTDREKNSAPGAPVPGLGQACTHGPPPAPPPRLSWAAFRILQCVGGQHQPRVFSLPRLHV